VSKPPINVPEVGAAFRALADEHAERRESAVKEANWRALQMRMARTKVAEEEPLFANQGARQASSWSFSRPSLRWWPAIGVATVGVAVAAAAFLIPTDLKYQLRDANAVNGTIQPNGQDGAIDFSDGSRIELVRGSSLKVDVKGAHGANATLAAGELDVRVRHHTDTHYRFLAGPYEVQVVGTQFRLSWQPESQLFSVVMREGRVRVLGPKLDRYLSTGEELRVDGSRALAAADPAPVAEVASPSAPQTEETKPGRSAAELGEGRPLGSVTGRDALGWSGLVSKGRFAEVVSEADALGLDRVLHERGASDLSSLAHAANYTGRSHVALSAWERLRQRFPGQSAARQAAFFIGRVHDQRGNQREALRWLSTYLAESPRDVYASEALGRKLLVVQKLEGALAARRIAREYVERFPSGAYAPTARSLLSNP